MILKRTLALPLGAHAVVLNEAVEKHVGAEVVGEARREKVGRELALRELDVVVGPCDLGAEFGAEPEDGAEQDSLARAGVEVSVRDADASGHGAAGVGEQYREQLVEGVEAGRDGDVRVDGKVLLGLLEVRVQPGIENAPVLHPERDVRVEITTDDDVFLIGEVLELDMRMDLTKEVPRPGRPVVVAEKRRRPLDADARSEADLGIEIVL